MTLREEPPLRRLKKKTGVECLWIYILAYLKSRDRYPYEIIHIIREKHGFDPGLVLPYVVFKKLEKANYVVSKTIGNRKYYSITNKGRRLLEDGLKYLEELVNSLKEAD
ncbi:MAG: PadR family transcriptional regulator [Thermoprotei archaeon]|nr:MAG: PadR family transcriptional regulator [Thermoprotei archaeon]